MVAKAMSAARDEILGRIRATERRPVQRAVDRAYRRAGSLGSAERTALFSSRVADYRAEVRFSDRADASAVVTAACIAHRASTVAVPQGLPGDWRPTGVEIVEDEGLSPRQLDEVDGVVTGCTLGIAETGTIVLSAGETEGRRALTLIPDLHVCVVPATKIVELVSEAFDVLDARRPLTFISGPSATSDIELTRVEGVHGPRTLVVVVVTDDE
jgi:L-lactate dehydrogenase complex protein LldG